VLQPAYSLTINSVAPQGTATLRFVTFVLPATIAACHAAIREQAQRIAALEDELAERTREAEELRPDADRWREFRRKSARRGL
jgi:hypothetical protein